MAGFLMISIVGKDFDRIETYDEKVQASQSSLGVGAYRTFLWWSLRIQIRAVIVFAAAIVYS